MLIFEDFRKYKKEDESVIKTLFNINIYININFRISNFFYRKNFFIISKIFWLVNRIIFSVDIDPGATLAGGFHIVHGIGLVIGRDVVSRGALKVYQGITIGGSNNQTTMYKGRLIKQPLLNGNVVIYSGASVIGAIIIGSNVTIGTNAVITKNIPNNSLVVGNNKLLPNEKFS